MPDPSIAMLLKGAISSAVTSVIPHVLNPWTRKKTLQFVHEELLASCETTEQANDLYIRIKDDRTLRAIAKLRSVTEVHSVIKAAIHPTGPTDPQHDEAFILTRALLAGLLRTTSKDTGSALTGSLVLDLYLGEQMPGFHSMIHDARRRRARPGQSAVQDLAKLLTHAGQTQMSILVNADGTVQPAGNAIATINITGRNAELLRQWMQGGQGSTLNLNSTDGEISQSYGHPELDRMLLPDLTGKDVRYEIEEVKTLFQCRVRVTAPNEPDVRCTVTIAYALVTKEMDVTFGGPECSLRFCLSYRAGDRHSVNVKLEQDSRDHVLPAPYRETLRAMRLLARTDMNVILPSGEQLVRPDGGTIPVERDELLFDGRIWTSDDRSEGHRIEDLLGVIGDVHLMYQKIATYLEETHGVDVAQVRVLDTIDEQSIHLLRRAVAAIERRTDSTPVDLNFSVKPELEPYLHQPADPAATQPPFLMNVTGVVDLGACVLKIDSPVSNLHTHHLEPVGDMITVTASGQLRTHQLEVHPQGSLQHLFTDPVSREYTPQP